MYSGNDYWMNYMERWFGNELIDKWHRYVKVEEISSNGKKINLEIYDTGNIDAPTIIFAPHFPTKKKYYIQWAEEVDSFLQGLVHDNCEEKV